MPMNFAENVFGQSYPKERLFKTWQSNKIPNSFIFNGQKGVGKFLLALEFIKLLNSANQDISKKISSLQEPYIKFIMPLPGLKSETSESEKTNKNNANDEIREQLNKKIDNPYHNIHLEKAGTIKISSIREIKKFTSLSFDEFDYRTVLINDAELMNEEAQNALLKSLEEPPAGVVFILLTNNINKLLPTIKSRCCLINFEPLQVSDVHELLIKYFGIENRIAEQAATFSEGSIINAIDLINNDLQFFLEKTISVLRFSLALKINPALKEISPIIKDSNIKSLKLLIKLIVIWLVDTQRNKNQIDELYFNSYKETIEKFNNRFPHTDVQKTINTLNYYSSIIDNNINLNIIALNLIFELASLREIGN